MSGRVRHITPKEREYLEHLLARAQDALGLAERVLAIGHPDSAVREAYEGCRRAVLALLALRGEASSKHGPTAESFEKEWIVTGLLPAEMGTFYRAMLARRQRAEYELRASFGSDDAGRWLAEARAFVHRVEDYVGGLPVGRRNHPRRRLSAGARLARRLDSVGGLSDAERALLQEVKRIVHRTVPGSELWLYGSSARGERRPDSDWDVLVLTERDVTRAEEESVLSALHDLEMAQEAGAFVALSFYSRKEWESGLVSVSPFRRYAERDAVAL